MNIFSKSVLAIALSSLSLCAASNALAADQIVLKVGHSAQPTFHMHKAWLKFAELVDKGSNGEIKVEVYPADQMGTSLEQLEYTQEGTLDMCSEDLSLLATWDKAYEAPSMPYVFTSREQALSVLNKGTYAEFLQGKSEELNLKTLGITENGFRQITNNTREIVTPADLKGIKIRTMQIDSHITAYKQLGANPTPMAFGEVYSALQQGVVDGEDNPLAQIRTMRFYEVQKYLTMANIVFSSDIIVMNLDRFNSLKPEQQKLLQDSMKEALAYQLDIIKSEEQENLDFFEKEGIKVQTLTQDQIMAFKNEVEKVRGDMVADVGQENWDVLQKAIAEYNNAHK